jgi:hypothetical protein
MAGRFCGLWFQHACIGQDQASLSMQRVTPKVTVFADHDASIMLSAEPTCMRPGMPCFASAGIGGRFCASTSAFICCGKVCAQGAYTVQQTQLIVLPCTLSNALPQRLQGICCTR